MPAAAVPARVSHVTPHLQRVAAAADAALQLGTLVQCSCYDHARALVAALAPQAKRLSLHIRALRS